MTTAKLDVELVDVNPRRPLAAWLNLGNASTGPPCGPAIQKPLAGMRLRRFRALRGLFGKKARSQGFLDIGVLVDRLADTQFRHSCKCAGRDLDCHEAYPCIGEPFPPGGLALFRQLLYVLFFSKHCFCPGAAAPTSPSPGGIEKVDGLVVVLVLHREPCRVEIVNSFGDLSREINGFPRISRPERHKKLICQSAGYGRRAVMPRNPAVIGERRAKVVDLARKRTKNNVQKVCDLRAKMLYFGNSFPKAAKISQGKLMKQSIIFGVVLTALSGCATTPSEPALPDGRAKVTVNSSATIAEMMSDYYRGQAAKKARAEPARKLSRLTISQIVERYMPADFKVFANEGVNLETVVDYDAGLPWTEAIGKPLSDAGVEMSANLDTKTMFLRAGITTIEQVLSQRVPADYTVYANEAVRLDTPIKFDRSKPWVEALGKALAAAGVSMTTNVDKKVIVLKPKERSRLIRFKDESEIASLPGSAPSLQRAESSGAVSQSHLINN